MKTILIVLLLSSTASAQSTLCDRIYKVELASARRAGFAFGKSMLKAGIPLVEIGRVSQVVNERGDEFSRMDKADTDSIDSIKKELGCK